MPVLGGKKKKKDIAWNKCPKLPLQEARKQSVK